MNVKIFPLRFSFSANFTLFQKSTIIKYSKSLFMSFIYKYKSLIYKEIENGCFV